MISVDVSARLGDVVQLMKKHDVSQLPVFENGEVVGILTETKVLWDVG